MSDTLRVLLPLLVVLVIMMQQLFGWIAQRARATPVPERASVLAHDRAAGPTLKADARPAQHHRDIEIDIGRHVVDSGSAPAHAPAARPAAALRRSIVMMEILGPPRALRSATPPF